MRCSISIFLIATALVAEGEDCEPAVDADQDGWIICTGDQDQFSGVCDCDDSNALIYPGAKETNSKYDDDCDGAPEWTSTDGMGEDFYGAQLESPVLTLDGRIVAAFDGRWLYSFDNFGKLVATQQLHINDTLTCTIVAITSHDQLAFSVSGAVALDNGTVEVCVCSLDQNMNLYASWQWGQALGQYSITSIEAASGDLLVAGTISDSSTSRRNGPLVLRLMSNNQLVWSQVDQADVALVAQAITEAPSGAILVGGWTYLTSAGLAVPWAERLSADGVLEREWVDWMELPILPSGMLTPWDGDIVLYGTDEDGCFAVGRFTEDLDPIWLWQRPSGECLGVANAGVETFTGDLAIVGAKADGNGGWCGLAYVLSPFGEMLIESRPCERDGFFGVVQMPDGGFVMTGQTDYKEGFILRMDKYLNVPPGSTPK